MVFVYEIAILLGLPTAVTGFFFWRLKRHIDKKEASREETEKARKKFEFLLLKSTGAAIALGEATAHAIINGKCNGEMTEALNYAKKVKHEQKDFLAEQSIKHMY